MNIRNQIKDFINTNENIFNHYNDKQTNNFKRLTNNFLDATTYGQAERYARYLMSFLLFQHGKSSLGPVLDSLHIYELYADYEYRKQRLHYVHQVYVFLLGLYLYHNNKLIRNCINREMEKTTKEIIFDNNNLSFRFSGGSEYGEFLYRWKIASLFHDIGNGISLCQNDNNKIVNHLRDIFICYDADINDLNSLYHFNHKDLCNQLASSIPEIPIEQYMNYQLNSPFNNAVYYDHGIIGSLIFLRLMNEEYKRNELNKFTYSFHTRVIWHESILKGSILQIAIAICLHNIIQYEKAFKEIAKKTTVFDLEERSLSWLLKIADILQEWDKPKTSENIDNMPIEPTDIQINFSGEEIIINNYLHSKLIEVNKAITTYTSRPDLIKFI